MKRSLQKFLKFKAFADSLADLSTCKRAKVGAIVFDSGFTQVLAIGYNGPPTMRENDSCSGEAGQCGCVHAEANALLKVRQRDLLGLWMYSTTFPCSHCAGLIANSGLITKLFYRDVYRDDKGAESLRAAGIEMVCSEWSQLESFLERDYALRVK